LIIITYSFKLLFLLIKYLGAGANKIIAYGVASVSGTILAVCSCTILPLFAGIYRMGAGIGPASAFLYAGPAINVLAIILTARILGMELGIARAVGAVVFSVVIGLIMQIIFGREDEKAATPVMVSQDDEGSRPLWKNVVYFALMVGILVFANWGKSDQAAGFWHMIYNIKWYLTSIMAVLLGIVLIFWFRIRWIRLLPTAVITALLGIIFPDYPLVPFSAAVIGLSIALVKTGGESVNWLDETWTLTKQILPLLLIGVLVAGALLGRPGGEGLIPSEWISAYVGGNSIQANLFASVVGAFMYFATLTEVPILQGLLGAGMGKGPALALLLAGPALSLPNMLVIRSIMGTKKTMVFIILVIIMACLTGYIFGLFF